MDDGSLWIVNENPGKVRNLTEPEIEELKKHNEFEAPKPHPDEKPFINPIDDPNATVTKLPLKSIRDKIKDEWKFVKIWQEVEKYIQKGDRYMTRRVFDNLFVFYYGKQKPYRYKLYDDLENREKGYDCWQTNFMYKVREARKECFPPPRTHKKKIEMEKRFSR